MKRESVIRAAWPDWAIFDSCWPNFLTKVSQIFYDFLGFFKIHYFLSKNWCGNFLDRFWKYLGYFWFQHLVTLQRATVMFVDTLVQILNNLGPRPRRRILKFCQNSILKMSSYTTDVEAAVNLLKIETFRWKNPSSNFKQAVKYTILVTMFVVCAKWSKISYKY